MLFFRILLKIHFFDDGKGFTQVLAKRLIVIFGVKQLGICLVIRDKERLITFLHEINIGVRARQAAVIVIEGVEDGDSVV